jgi:hypothetical protein
MRKLSRDERLAVYVLIAVAAFNVSRFIPMI